MGRAQPLEGWHWQPRKQLRPARRYMLFTLLCMAKSGGKGAHETESLPQICFGESKQQAHFLCFASAAKPGFSLLVVKSSTVMS